MKDFHLRDFWCLWAMVNLYMKVWSIVDLERKSGIRKVLNISVCYIHAMYNAFQEGLQEFEEECSDVIINIYHFFRRCSARCHDFSQHQLKAKAPWHNFVKNVPTRWITVGEAIDRLTSNQALTAWPSKGMFWLHIFWNLCQKRA